MLKTKRKVSLLRFSPVFGPKSGEDQKKGGLHSDLVRFLAQNLVKTKTKKKSSVRFCPFVCSNFVLNLQRGGMPHFCIHFMLITLSWRQKRGTMAPWPPPKYAPAG